jgi:hypothetical protein
MKVARPDETLGSSRTLPDAPHTSSGSQSDRSTLPVKAVATLPVTRSTL